jgi:hypothetical protein
VTEWGGSTQLVAQQPVAAASLEGRRSMQAGGGEYVYVFQGEQEADRQQQLRLQRPTDQQHQTNTRHVAAFQACNLLGMRRTP